VRIQRRLETLEKVAVQVAIRRDQHREARDAGKLRARGECADRDRHSADPDDGEEGEEELGAVGKQNADARTRADTLTKQVGSECGRSPIELSVRYPIVIGYEELALGKALGLMIEQGWHGKRRLDGLAPIQMWIWRTLATPLLACGRELPTFVDR
jgi:hypothetical protein